MKRSALPLVCGRVGFGADVLDAELLAGTGEGFRAIAAAVVGHDALDGDAEAFEVGDGGERKATALSFFSSGKMSARATREWSSMATWANSQPAPLAAAVAGAASGDAMADGIEAAELFDVEMDDLAGLLALVAWSWLLRLEAESRLRPRRLRMRETVALEMPSSAGDVLLGAALAAQALDGIGCGERDLAWR